MVTATNILLLVPPGAMLIICACKKVYALPQFIRQRKILSCSHLHQAPLSGLVVTHQETEVGFGQMELILTTTMVTMQTQNSAFTNSIIITILAGHLLPVQVIVIGLPIFVNLLTDP